MKKMQVNKTFIKFYDFKILPTECLSLGGQKRLLIFWESDIESELATVSWPNVSVKEDADK